VNDNWFSDDLPLNVDAKQVIERTSGKWIIEAQELSGMHKSQAEHLKSMLSRQVDGPVRMAYARLPLEQPRQFIIIGTTNSSEYLSDSTGNRRYWPVRIEMFNLDLIAKWRDQWWAEAAFYESQGESIRLNPQLYGDAEIEQESRRAADPWEMRIKAAWDDDSHRITPNEIWLLLNVPIERQSHREEGRIAAIMKRCGFKRGTVRDDSMNGKAVWGWHKGKTLRGSDD
jgi:predicted P-loop ATPase